MIAAEKGHHCRMPTFGVALLQKARTLLLFGPILCVCKKSAQDSSVRSLHNSQRTNKYVSLYWVRALPVLLLVNANWRTGQIISNTANVGIAKDGAKLLSQSRAGVHQIIIWPKVFSCDFNFWCTPSGCKEIRILSRMWLIS